MSSTETVNPSHPTPLRSFFRELFSTYGWVVVLVVTVIGGFFFQVSQVGERVAKVEGRLDGIELRLTKLEGQLDAIDQRLNTLERRFDVFDQRLNTVEHRLEAMENKLDRVLDAVTKKP